MAVPLTNADLRGALDALHVIGEDSRDEAAFARRGLDRLPRLVSSELTTLSVCNLETGHRSVVSDCPGAISKRQVEVFDRYFFDHPLVREHGRNPRAVTRSIGDLLPYALQRLLSRHPHRSRDGGANPRRRQVAGELRPEPQQARFQRA